MARKWWTLLVVNAAGFMLLLDVTVVTVALPALRRDLGAGFEDLQWVLDAYALTLAALLLAAGSVADALGRRRLFLVGLAIFGLASLACALAWSPLALILGRGAQGIGGAILFATALALLAQEFDARTRGLAFGVLGATTGAALAVGPLVGGALSEGPGWRWIFLVNLPIVALAAAVTWARVAESRDPAAGAVDWLGVVALSAAVSALVLALIRANVEGWGSPVIVGLFAATAVGGGAFLMRQQRARSPLLDLALFRDPSFVGVSVAAFALAASVLAVFLFLTLYLHAILGHSALGTGVRLLPITVVAFAVAPAAGRLSDRFPPRAFLGGGLFVVAAGLLLMGGLDPGSNAAALMAGSVVAGLGIGLVNPPLLSTALAVSPAARSGMAAGANNTFRQVGLATGIAGFGALFQARVHDRLADLVGPGAADALAARVTAGAGGGGAARAAFVGALNDVLLVAGGVAAVGAVVALALVRVAPAAGRSRAGRPAVVGPLAAIADEAPRAQS